MSQESCFLSSQVTSAALCWQHSRLANLHIFSFWPQIFSYIVKFLILCHRVHIIFMICDGLRVLFFYPVVQNFGPASLKMSWTVSFKGSGHAFYTGQWRSSRACTYVRTYYRMHTGQWNDRYVSDEHTRRSRGGVLRSIKPSFVRVTLAVGHQKLNLVSLNLSIIFVKIIGIHNFHDNSPVELINIVWGGIPSIICGRS